jgi:hypothetical protein
LARTHTTPPISSPTPARSAETAAGQRAEDAQAELFALRATLEDEQAARQAETDVLVEDTNRLNSRLLELEEQNRTLKQQVDFGPAGGIDAAHGDDGGAVRASLAEALESEIRSKDDTILGLNAELSNALKSVDKRVGETRSREEQIVLLEEQVAAKHKETQALKDELASRYGGVTRLEGQCLARIQQV